MKTNDYVSFFIGDVKNLTNDKLEQILPGADISKEIESRTFMKGFFKYFALESDCDVVGTTPVVISMAIMYIEEESTGYLLRVVPDNIKYHR